MKHHIEKQAILACILTSNLFLTAFHFSSLDNDPVFVERAYSDSKGDVHIVYRDGDRTVPKEKDQVDTSSIKVADNRKTVGWTVRFDNCCTSYPIPLVIAIYKDGKVRQRLHSGLMIYDWNFVEGGKQVAFCSGTVHGNFPTNCELHDAVNGRLLTTFRGGRRVPKWMKALDHEQQAKSPTS
jgi:hypothetical protein